MFFLQLKKNPVHVNPICSENCSWSGNLACSDVHPLLPLVQAAAAAWFWVVRPSVKGNLNLRAHASSAVLVGRCGGRGFPLFVNKISRHISSLFLHFPQLCSSCREVKCDFLHLGVLAFFLEIYNWKSGMCVDWASYTDDLNTVFFKTWLPAFVSVVDLLRWFELADKRRLSQRQMSVLMDHCCN